jgi:hypothetical protein
MHVVLSMCASMYVCICACMYFGMMVGLMLMVMLMVWYQCPVFKPICAHPSLTMFNYKPSKV